MRTKKAKKKPIGLRLRFRDAAAFRKVRQAAEIADMSLNKFITGNAIQAAMTLIHQHETGKKENFVSAQG